MNSSIPSSLTPTSESHSDSESTRELLNNRYLFN